MDKTWYGPAFLKYKHLNRAFLFEIRLYQMISDDFRSFSLIFMNFYRQLSIKTDDVRY